MQRRRCRGLLKNNRFCQVKKIYAAVFECAKRPCAQTFKNPYAYNSAEKSASIQRLNFASYKLSFFADCRLVTKILELKRNEVLVRLLQYLLQVLVKKFFHFRRCPAVYVVYAYRSKSCHSTYFFVQVLLLFYRRGGAFNFFYFKSFILR